MNCLVSIPLHTGQHLHDTVESLPVSLQSSDFKVGEQTRGVQPVEVVILHLWISNGDLIMPEHSDMFERCKEQAETLSN